MPRPFSDLCDNCGHGTLKHRVSEVRIVNNFQLSAVVKCEGSWRGVCPQECSAFVIREQR